MRRKGSRRRRKLGRKSNEIKLDLRKSGLRKNYDHIKYESKWAIKF